MRKLIFVLSSFILLSGCAGTTLFAANPEEQPDALNEKTLAMPDQLAERAPVPSFYYRAKPAATYYQSPTKEKKIALTFDDGPDATYTGQVLDILKQQQVSATFFVIGNQVPRHPEVVKRIVNEGHVIASHTWSHPNLVKENDAKVRQEITKTYQIVEKLTGKKMAMLRPPYGAVKGKEKLIHQMGISVIQWDIDTLDWEPGQTPDRIFQNVVQHASPGSIVLQHSGGGNRSATVQALPRLIQQLKKEGYQFVTVNELLDIPAYHQD